MKSIIVYIIFISAFFGNVWACLTYKAIIGLALNITACVALITCGLAMLINHFRSKY